MRTTCYFWIALTVILPRAAAAQGNPLGPEFRVNTFTTSSQRAPSVAADPSGNFVVVWESYLQDGSLMGVFGQRYISSGAPLGPEFRVNTFIVFGQDAPAVAADSSGNFVVVWRGNALDGSGDGVVGQRYASSGVPVGPEFRVNTYVFGNQGGGYYGGALAVASDSSGNFVVVWQSADQDGSGYGVFGQRFASSGAPLGPEFRANTYTTGDQGGGDWGAGVVVASDPSGNFVVVWESDTQDGSDTGVFGQRYSSAGNPLGPEFRVNTYTTSYQGGPSVAADPSGNFVVVWHSNTQDGSLYGIFGQRYASSGIAVGPEFRVNTYTTGPQGGGIFGDALDVASDSAGNFVVVWKSLGQDGSNYGVFGQRYTSSGAPLGPEFRVNTSTAGFQYRPSVSADSAGNFIVAWSSSPGGPSGDVFGQRYSMIVPVELMHFRVE
jgi:hypothetical protein